MRAARQAFREKYLAIWQTWSGSDVNCEVRDLACGLAALGVGRDIHKSFGEMKSYRRRKRWLA